jgi:hypothetical protein
MGAGALVRIGGGGLAVTGTSGIVEVDDRT